jgi:hypothetical protein
MLTIADAAHPPEPGWLVTVAFVAAGIVYWIGFGALRLGRVGRWYHSACAVPVLLLVAAAGLQSVLLTVVGFGAMFALGAYGTVMRFRPPKDERPRTEPSP